MTMKKLKFMKMSGSGNDFVVIDNRHRALSGNLHQWAKRLCHRQWGVGADGLLLLERSSKADFRMLYFNADGSRATMCGNGARCMAWVADYKGAAKSNFDFETDAGVVHAHVAGQVVKITMTDPKDYRPTMVRAGGRSYRVVFINTGVPHAVVFVPDAARVDLPTIGRLLRFHKAFGPQGTNVNFVQKINSHTLKVRTYERGVEGETLACGTGVTASALAANLKGLVKGVPVRCQTTGGDVLDVGFELRPGNSAHPARHVTLRGPVKLTFQGEF
jgi:diaminopimelate epimerase